MKLSLLFVILFSPAFFCQFINPEQIINDNEIHAQISDDAAVITLREQKAIVLDSVFAYRIDSALTQVRNEIDTLSQLHIYHEYQTKTLGVYTLAEWSKNWYTSLVTGEKYIDSLNNYYNLVQVDTPQSSQHPFFVLKYAGHLKIPLLAELFKKSPDIVFAEPNYTLGDGDDIQFVNKSPLWHFAFSLGRGDCPAGCTERYYWYVTIDMSSNPFKVILEEQKWGNPGIPIINRWNIPQSLTMTMFESAVVILDSIKYSKTWWIRRHAVDGIRYIFTHDYPIPIDNSELWYDLKENLYSLKDEVISVLSDAMNDPDKDVQSSAKKALDTIKVILDVEDLPVNIPQFKLFQNYPNPFNPATRINYSINKTQHITLKVYDILGNEIITLVNEKKPAGEYEVEFSGNSLASGVYFYTLRAGNFSQTKKLILLK